MTTKKLEQETKVHGTESFPTFTASALMGEEYPAPGTEPMSIGYTASDRDTKFLVSIENKLLSMIGISANQIEEGSSNVPKAIDLTEMPLVLTSNPDQNALYQFYYALAKLRNLCTEAHNKDSAPVVSEKSKDKKPAKRAPQLRIASEQKNQADLGEESGISTQILEKPTQDAQGAHAIRTQLYTSVADSLVCIGRNPFLTDSFINNDRSRRIFLQLIYSSSLENSHLEFLKKFMLSYIDVLLQLKGKIPAIEYDLIEIVLKGIKVFTEVYHGCAELSVQKNSIWMATHALCEGLKDKTKSLTDIENSIKPIEGLDRLPLNLQHWVKNLIIKDFTIIMLGNLPDNLGDFRRYALVLKKAAQDNYLPSCLDCETEWDDSSFADRLISMLQGLYYYTINIDFHYGYIPLNRSPHPSLNFNACNRIDLLVVLFTIFEKRPTNSIITESVQRELVRQGTHIIKNHDRLLMQPHEKRKVISVASELISHLDTQKAISLYGITFKDCDEIMHVLLEGGSHFDRVRNLLSYNQKAFFADAEPEFTSLLKILQLFQKLGLNQAQDKQLEKKDTGAKTSQKNSGFDTCLMQVPPLKDLEKDIALLSRFKEEYPLTIRELLKILMKADLIPENYGALNEAKQKHHAKKYLELQFVIYEVAIQFGADSDTLKSVELSLKLDMNAFYKHQAKKNLASDLELAEKKKGKSKSQSKKDKNKETVNGKKEEKRAGLEPVAEEPEEAEEKEVQVHKAPEPSPLCNLQRKTPKKAPTQVVTPPPSASNHRVQTHKAPVLPPIRILQRKASDVPTQVVTPPSSVSNQETRTTQIPAANPVNFRLATHRPVAPDRNSLEDFPAMRSSTATSSQASIPKAKANPPAARNTSNTTTTTATVATITATTAAITRTAATITTAAALTTTIATAKTAKIATTAATNPVTATSSSERTKKSQSISTVSIFAPAKTSTPPVPPATSIPPIVPSAPVPAVETKTVPAENKSDTTHIATEHRLVKDNRRILDKALLPTVLLEFLKNAMPTLPVLLTGPAVYNYFRKELKERIRNNVIDICVFGVRDVQSFDAMLSQHQVSPVIKLKQGTIPWIQLSLGPKSDRYTLNISFGLKGESIEKGMKRLQGEADANLYALCVNLSEAWAKTYLYFEGDIESIRREICPATEIKDDGFFSQKPRRFTTVINAGLLYDLPYTVYLRTLLKNKSQTNQILGDFLNNNPNALLNAQDMAAAFEEVLKYVDVRAVVSVYNSQGIIFPITKIHPDHIDKTVGSLPACYSLNNPLEDVFLAKKKFAMIVVSWYGHYVANLVYSDRRMTMHPTDFKNHLKAAMENAPFKNFMDCVDPAYQVYFDRINKKYLDWIICSLSLELTMQNTALGIYLPRAGIEIAFDYQAHVTFVMNKYLGILKMKNIENGDDNPFYEMLDVIDNYYQSPYIEKMAQNYVLKQGYRYLPQQPIAQIPMVPGHYSNNNPSAFYPTANVTTNLASAYPGPGARVDDALGVCRLPQDATDTSFIR